MSQLVKVKVRPGGTIQFPNTCVNCSRPGADTLELSKRIGRISRSIDVPLCADCAREVGRQSGEEERLEKIGRLITGIVAVIAFFLFLFILPGGLVLWLRIFTALIPAVAAGIIVSTLFGRQRQKAARPEKQAILNSTRIANFSWRATTFEFENEAFAKSFAELNEPQLMDI